MSKENVKMSFSEQMKINLRTVKLIFKRRPEIIVSRLISVIWNSLTPYVGIYLSALIISELAGGKDREVLTKLVLIMLISSAVIALVAAFLEKWKNKCNSTQFYDYEKILCDKLLDMDFCDQDDPKTHQILSTIRANENGGGWGIHTCINGFETLTSAVFSFAGGIAMTVKLFTSRVPDSAGAYTILNSPFFIVLIVAIMLCVIYLAPYLSGVGERYYAKAAGTHNLANRLFGFYGYISYNNPGDDIRTYRFDKISHTFNSDKTNTFCSKGIFAKLARERIGFLAAAGEGISVMFTGVAYVFVCLKAIAGAFGIGEITQYVASITRVAGDLTNGLSSIGRMRNNAEFLKLIFEYLDIPNNMYQGTLTVEKRNDRKYEIEFRDVSFKYPGSDDYSLRHVNMKFNVGERLAVVGQNGSGKTTFIKLLCRLYDPTEGEILLNGINIRKYNYDEYMSVFSVVFQDTELLSYKLCDNVAVGTDCDRSRVEDCLVKAGFGERLKYMPSGIDTYLYKEYNENGVNVSGGEAQKIELARTLYKDAPFIILDEPTAALDPIAEAEIYTKFDAIVDDKTAVYISHRLSSCRFCDNIVVFDKGSVCEQGSHDELVANESGKYHELWFAQAQYYENDEEVRKLFK